MEVKVPPGALFVASAPERVYFPVEDPRWHRIAASDRRWFSTERTARDAGYSPAPPGLEGLSEFELIEEIGRGATATVYRARDTNLDREVAIKVVHRAHHDDEETLARSFREARVVARLDHPGIVSVHAVRRLPSGGLALVMEYIPGKTLRDLIREEGALPIARVETIVREVGEALSAAHAQGIVHRDVKPHNIFLHEATGRPLLADFGIAIPLGESTRITHAGAVIGTPAYMSPEQFEGDGVDGRSDLYSLGLVAWEMLTGNSPWEGDSLFNIIYKQKTVALPPLKTLRSDVPPRLRIAVEKALQKNPDDRWSSVDEFLEFLGGKSGGLRWRLASLLPRPRRRAAAALSTGRVSRVDAPTIRYRPGELDPGAAPEPFTPVQSRRTRSRRWTAALLVLLGIGVIGAAGAGLRLQWMSGDSDGRSGSGEVERHASVATVAEAAEPRPEPPAAPIEADSAGALLAGGVPPDSSFGLTAADSIATVSSAPPADGTTNGSQTPSGEQPLAASSAEEAPAPPPEPVLPVDDRPVAIAVGGLHSCAVEGGSVLCWGGNERGQIGRGYGPRQAAPVALALEAAPHAVAAGGFHTCLLDRTGVVHCWGDNSEGQLGAGSGADSGPVRIADLRFFSLAAGLSHTCGISRNGAAYCWGSNAQGQLGDGSTTGRPRPTRVSSPERFVSITTGWTHSCALGGTGRAFCWGENSRGQLGDGSTTRRSSPAPVAGDLRFQAISAGSAHTCALTLEGALYCWGQNGDGRLGDGSTSDRSAPARVQAEQRFLQVSAGGRHTCALTSGGVAYCWGQNGYGQLGDGGTASRSRPVAVQTELRFRSIRAGGSHTCGITTDGDRYCWGFNIEGQLGDGSLAHRGTPATVRSAGGAD